MLLVPDSPGTGAALAQLADNLLVAGRAVVLPDLLGAGGTTCPSAGDLDRQADLLQDVLAAVSWRRALVIGDGVGAAVAARLASRHPELVAGLGLLSEPYVGAQPGPSWDGTMSAHGEHLVSLWHELRDAAMFAPWWEPRAGTRRKCDLPGADVLHQVFVDTLPHVPAHRNLAEAARAAWPALRAAVAVPVSSGADVGELLSALSRYEPAASAANAAGADSGAPPVGGVSRDYVDCSFGQLHLRGCAPEGGGQQLPAVLLHANPGSALALEPLIAALGTDRRVVAVDLPGHGRSDPLPEDSQAAVSLEYTYAPLILTTLDRLGVERFDAYGTHTGAGLACELAILAPERVRSVVLDGVPLFDDDPELVETVLAAYFLDLTPDQHGSHLLRAWHISWDMALWWPWFRHDLAGLRDTNPYPTATLQRLTGDFLRSQPTYGLSYRAAWRWRATMRLPLVTQPALVGATPSDPLQAMTPHALDLLPHATVTEFGPLHSEAGVRVIAERIRAFTATSA